ncbi:hypothetical protein [Hymenobacter elongatus]|uniref:Abi-like protein n=1 Tax=Hymenobacter elongatus TaxID=877208 RepID=A0A4Z0PJX5_9BACT|nr:hypothetical protein [Hymenobacter elongatus]TGE15975.1 hypothetical protein E5J99_11130 [Hymenobacter elongatus]
MATETRNFYKSLIDTLLEARSRGNPHYDDIYENTLSILVQATANGEENIYSILNNVAKISDILSLDTKISIDYISIDDSRTRHQLRLDNLAMGRSRYGLNQHTEGSSFDDYCRFAQLQAEELINFFYTQKFSTPVLIQQFVINNNKNYRENIASRTVANKVTDITYFYKLFAFNQIYQFKEYWTLLQVSYVRNQASHRCSITGDKEDELMCDYEIKQLPGKMRNSLTYSDQKLYDKCEKIMFRREADYEKVSIALHALYKTVTTNL